MAFAMLALIDNRVSRGELVRRPSRKNQVILPVIIAILTAVWA